MLVGCDSIENPAMQFLQPPNGQSRVDKRQLRGRHLLGVPHKDDQPRAVRAVVRLQPVPDRARVDAREHRHPLDLDRPGSELAARRGSSPCERVALISLTGSIGKVFPGFDRNFRSSAAMAYNLTIFSRDHSGKASRSAKSVIGATAPTN